MPTLYLSFSVLENDFNKVMEGGSNDRGAKGWEARSLPVLDCVQAEDPRNVKPVRKLQRGGWIEVGDSVNGIS